MKITKGALPRWVREFVEASGYKGRKFEVEVRSTFTVPSDAGLWYGGTCEKFYSLSPDGSEAARLNNAAPWRECGRGETVSIPEGVLLARRSWFCGKDSGFTFYVAPPMVRQLTGCDGACAECEKVGA